MSGDTIERDDTIERTPNPSHSNVEAIKWLMEIVKDINVNTEAVVVDYRISSEKISIDIKYI